LAGDNDIRSINLLGHGPVGFQHSDNLLNMNLLDKLPNGLLNGVASVFKISVAGELERTLYQGDR